MRELMVLRHGKSDWGADTGSDHERPINSRGVRSARAVGRWVSSVSLIPDLVVSSTAVRARTTAELAIASGDWPVKLQLEDRLYAADPMVAIDVIASTSPAVERLMVVGHQPTWSSLVGALIGGGAVEMPTAGLSVLNVRVSRWSDIAWSSASLAMHVYPRALVAAGFDGTT